MTGIHDSVETYEPKVNMGYESSIPKVDNSFDDITDDNGNINIIINSEVIGQTLAKKIYSSWASGLRELYNNEARACRTAKKMGADPSIVITVDPSQASRQVIIQGVDSLGITKAMFNKVLRVIGTSGNTDGEEIGQYGMGFISYALMTDALLLETWSRETNEHYAMLCDSGLKFKPIPIDTDNDVSTMTNFGTKLTMTCNDDVNWSTLVSNITKLARFSQIPTKIILLDNVDGDDSYYGRRNGGSESYDKGVLSCNSYKNGMDYLKNQQDYEWIKNSSSTNPETILLYDEITIDNEDYRFDALLVISKTSYGTIKIREDNSSIPLLLVGTAIDGDLRINGMHSAIVNIKNERKYSPVASRDSIDTKAIDSLQDQIHEDICNYMSKYDIGTIDEYNKSLHKCVLAADPMYEIKKYMSMASNDISRTLNTGYSTPEKRHHTLNDMLAVGGNIIALKTLRSSLMDILTEHFDGTVQFFRIPTKLSDEERGHRISLFKSLGVIMGEDYKKANKMKEKRATIVNAGGKKVSFSGDRGIVLYNSRRGTKLGTLWGSANGWRSGAENFSSTITEVNDNIHNCIMSVDTKRFQTAIGVSNQISNDWKIVHDMKGLSSEINTLDKVLNKVSNKSYQTNHGIVKGNELAGYYTVVVMSDLELLDNIEFVHNDRHGNDSSHDTRTSNTVIGVTSVNDYVELQLYSEFVKNGILTFEDDTIGNMFTSVTRCDVKFNNENYKRSKSNNVARMYWIEKLLPDVYADIFTNAMMYNTEKIDQIEKTARALNEVLKQ